MDSDKECGVPVKTGYVVGKNPHPNAARLMWEPPRRGNAPVFSSWNRSFTAHAGVVIA
jgi:hypothetical protein